MIRHTVIFTLKHAHGSLQEKAFLRDAKVALEKIPGVEKFEQLKQVSKKNDYEFGFSMAVDHGRVAVSAVLEDSGGVDPSDNSCNSAGAAYVFE